MVTNLLPQNKNDYSSNEAVDKLFILGKLITSSNLDCVHLSIFNTKGSLGSFQCQKKKTQKILRKFLPFSCD